MAKTKPEAPEKPEKTKGTPSATRKPTRLGRGLSALMAHPVQAFPPTTHSPPTTSTTALPTESPAAQATTAPPSSHQTTAQSTTRPTEAIGLTYIALDAVRPNPNQPRQSFPEEALKRLADSIRNDGLMQPIIVRPVKSDGKGDREVTTPGQTKDDEHNSNHAVTYELVAGERRLRAAEFAGLTQLPAIVRPLDDRQSAEWALIENLQREDLNPIDRAQAFQSLQSQFSLSHDEIAQRVSIDRSTVSNLLRLLNLCNYAQRLIRDGLLSAGQAKALLAVTDHERQELLAQRIIAQGWSVRQVEQEVRRLVSGQGVLAGSVFSGKPKSATPTHLRDLEQQIGRQLGTKAKLRSGRKKGSGTLSIEFYSLDQFDSLMQRMDVNVEMD